MLPCEITLLMERMIIQLPATEHLWTDPLNSMLYFVHQRGERSREILYLSSIPFADSIDPDLGDTSLAVL